MKAYQFSPSHITGLQLWLDATTGLFDATSGGSAVTTDGSAVARWEDQSGNGRNAFVYTGTPTLTTIGGKKFIVFDGLSAMEGANAINELPCTVITVLQWTQENGINIWFEQWDEENGDNIALYAADSGAEFGWRGYNGIDLNSTDDTWPLDETILATTIFNQEDSKHFRNGSAFGTGDTGSKTPSGDYFLGIFRGADAPMYYKIAEILVYSSALQDQELQQVQGYLNDKYSIY